MSIKMVLFDIGGVLIRYDQALTHNHLVDRGVPADRAGKFYEGDAYRAFARGWIESWEFASWLRAELGVDWSDSELQAAHDIQLYEVDPGVVGIVREIQAGKAVMVGLLTDTNVWQTRREKEMMPPLGKFHAEVRSYEIRRCKRDPGAFSMITSWLGYRVGQRQGEILLVDDKPDICQLAEAAGFRAIRFESAEQLRGGLVEHGLL